MNDMCNIGANQAGSHRENNSSDGVAATHQLCLNASTGKNIPPSFNKLNSVPFEFAKSVAQVTLHA